MRARYRTWLWLLLVGLAPQAGCVTLTDATVSFQAGPKTPDGSGSTPTLPDDEAERVCLKVAAEMGRNGHPREAIDELERARARDPKLDVTHRLALLYEQAGDYARALAEYNKELAARHAEATAWSRQLFGWITVSTAALKQSEANLYNDIGYCLYRKGDWAESAKYLRQALEADPRHATAWNNLGFTLAELGHPEESLDAFRHAVSQSDAYCNLAFVQAKHGKLAEAGENYRKALELDPQNQKARTAVIELNKVAQRMAGKPAPAPAQ